MRCVLDTNVVVSALRSPRGASAAVMGCVVEGRVRLLGNTALFLEYEAIIGRPEHMAAARLTDATRAVMLDELADRMESVMTHFRWRPQLSDAADEMVLEVAINGRADAIVTFNRRHFLSAARFGINVISPSELLGMLA